MTPPADSSHLSGDDIRRYLDRIGISEAPQVHLDWLTRLQQAHLSSVPFENLDVVAGLRVTTDLDHSVSKILDLNRGGWCFEVNGAFAALLEAIGFQVSLLGAAVLLDGPSKVIDHLTLEVVVDEPFLVDVGFGDSFSTPLRLNSGDAQDGGTGVYQLIASPQGTTLTRHDDDGVPAAQYRFKRVAHSLEDFTPASDALQGNPELHWSNKPFATRLIEGGPKRVTLLKDRLKISGPGEEEVTPVSQQDWPATLKTWFAIELEPMSAQGSDEGSDEGSD